MINKIELNVGLAGKGSVIIDGKEVGHMVTGINVRIRPGKITRVFVSMNADLEMKAQAEIAK